MASPLAVVGLTWDGYDVQRSDLDVFLEITEGLNEMPELRSFHQVIPFRHGRTSDTPHADHRVLVLNGVLLGPSGNERAAYRGYVDEVKAAFTPFGPTRTLVATLEDGTTRWIRARPVDMRPVPIVPGAANISIELVADDPFWYSGNEAIAMDSGYILNEGEFMDAGGEVIGIPTSGLYETTINVSGSAPIDGVRVTVSGASSGAVGVENRTLGVGFTGPTLAAGEDLVVDSGLRDIRLNGGLARHQTTLLAGNQHGEYFRLVPGANSIRITGSPSEVRVRFTLTYL